MKEAEDLMVRLFLYFELVFVSLCLAYNGMFDGAWAAVLLLVAIGFADLSGSLPYLNQRKAGDPK